MNGEAYEPTINSTNHRIILAVIRSRIIGKYGDLDNNSPRSAMVSADISRLDEATEDHIRARTAYHVTSSDETMTHLVGTWSRVSRIVRELEEKYV